jgi:glycosyltransferase involved in cell wall biosynthesis
VDVTALRTLQVGMEWFAEHPGGLNRMFANLCAGLAGGGVEVTGLVTGSPKVGTLSGGLVRSFAPTSSSLVQRLQSARSAALPWLREARDGVVGAHFALNTIPLVDCIGSHPLVVHFHGPWAQESRLEGDSAATVWLKEWIERTVYARADAAIVLSDAFAEVLNARFGVPAERIHVIPGGVEVERFAGGGTREEARTALGWPTDRPIVLCVRRLVRRMGIDQLIDAAAEVRRSVPDVLVLIAGSGAMRDDLSRRIAERGLAESVCLVGFVPDDRLPLAYRAANLSIVPSIALEGFGLVAAESLAAGTPVLVTPVGGLAGVVAPLAPELVATSSAPADLADALRAILLGERAVPEAAACSAYAIRRFAWREVVRQVRDVYEGARAR